MSHKKNIALTGLMGSGKSSVGKALAKLLQLKFVDTDALIEAKEGQSINKIFSERGEKYFRDLESKIIEEVCDEENQIISLGGGAVVNKKNRALIRKNCKLVALVADPKDLYERVKRRKDRPLLNQGEDQLLTLERLWLERKPAYYDSDLQLETSGKSIDSVANEIISLLKLSAPKTEVLKVDIPRKNAFYSIRFADLPSLNLGENNIDKLKLGKQILILTQAPVAKHYLQTVVKQLSHDFKLHTLIIEDGESAKNFFTYQLIIQKLLSLKFERKDTLIALGGGVVGDLAGFAASTYYRGIHYIQIPTTLLAMIDSSVGGKTAINVPEGKNLIGTFYQPNLVHIDVDNLQTLSDREFKSGLGEMVKYALLGAKWDPLLKSSESFLNFIAVNTRAILSKDHDVLKQAIEHCLRIKTQIVIEDETERNLRMYLNLGHTFGHAIEELTQYQQFSHGEAVTMGIICACYLSEELGCLKPGHTDKVINLMENLSLNYRIPSELKTKDIINSFKHDKKIEAGISKFVIPKSRIGKVDVVAGVDMNLVKKAIDRNRS